MSGPSQPPSRGLKPNPNAVPFILEWIVKNKRQVLGGASAAAGLYLLYRAYHSESASHLNKMKQGLQGWLQFLAIAGSTASSAMGDLQAFLSSDSNDLPRSLVQLAKLVQSPEVQASVASTMASMGRGLQSSFPAVDPSAPSPFLQQIIDAVLSDRGTTLIGLAIERASRTITATACEHMARMQREQAASGTQNEFYTTCLDLLSSRQGEQVMTLMINKSIKTMVSTYVDATIGYNYYNDMVASVARQEHRDAISDIMSRVTATFIKESMTAYNLSLQQQRSGGGGGGGGSSGGNSNGSNSGGGSSNLPAALQQPAPAGAPAPAPQLSYSSNSSSTNSVISLPGHTSDGPLPPRPPINRRPSLDHAMAMDMLRQQATADVSTTVGLVLGAAQARGHGRVNGLRSTQLAQVQVSNPGTDNQWWMKPMVQLMGEQDVRSLALQVAASCTREFVKEGITSGAREGPKLVRELCATGVAKGADVLAKGADVLQQQRHVALSVLVAILVACFLRWSTLPMMLLPGA